MSATTSVQVKYRHLEIAAAAPFRDVGDGTFRLTLDAPPPVRTVLSIDARAYEVVEVTEVAADASARGCVVRAVDADRLPTTVGTERLRGGSLGGAEPTAAATSQPSGTEADTDGDGYGAHMAVPAPVMGEDTSDSEPIDVGDNNDDNGSSAEPASDETATPGEGASRGKKRRGRQRK